MRLNQTLCCLLRTIALFLSTVQLQLSQLPRSCSYCSCCSLHAYTLRNGRAISQPVLPAHKHTNAPQLQHRHSRCPQPPTKPHHDINTGNVKSGSQHMLCSPETTSPLQQQCSASRASEVGLAWCTSHVVRTTCTIWYSTRGWPQPSTHRTSQ